MRNSDTATSTHGGREVVPATADDLFCGAGGSSLGAELAGARLRLGLNHWDRAVETHATNFQHADHDCADVSALTTARIRGYITGGHS
jgi:site-specific DNA-cytosine methylase